jgi:16S rRNA (cytidine1402-2'-O)-methyltransferase
MTDRLNQPGAPGLASGSWEGKNLNTPLKASGPAAPLAPGLYLVATPIGNLGDITLRALDVLRGADRIACEDTRHTQKLLNHFQIATPTVSCHEHNEHRRAEELVSALKGGARIALVSDAGMPGISDPGGWLTAAAIAARVPVIPIPGASAAVSALVASGLPATEFHFLGFLPEKAGARRTRLEALARDPLEEPRTLIFYEAPHRIEETLADLEAVWGPGLRVVLARELTKLHEEFLRGTVAEVRHELAGRERIRGEITLLIEAPARSAHAPEGQAGRRETLSARIGRLQSESSIDEKEALKRLARELGRSKSELYRELQRERANRS